jgi:hypothetical protein
VSQQPENKWKPLIFGLTLILLVSGLSFGTGASGGSTISALISPYTYTIAGTNGVYSASPNNNLAQFTFSETNFSRLMNDDILASSLCTNGCTSFLTPAAYNLTNKIAVKVPSVSILGTFASVIYPQSTFTTATFNVTGNSFKFEGARIDDFNRRFVPGTCSNLAGTFCHIPFAVFAASCNILNSQIFNITTTGVYLTIFSNNCNVFFNTIVGIPAQFANASLSVMQGIEGSGMNQKIEFNTVSYIRAGAGIRMGGGATNNAVHSFAMGNVLFHNEYGIGSFRGIDIKMIGNTIYNSTSYGIYLDSGIAAPNVWGPASITGNTISESGQGLCCGASPGTIGHIELRGTRCCWYSVSIVGNSMLDRQSNLTTLYDIRVGTINYENLTITGNSVGKTRGTPTIILSVNPPDTSWTIADNPGFNPQPKRGITAGASPYTYTNNDGYKEQLELTNVAGLTGLTCRGTAQIIQLDGITPMLNTVDTCVFTWAVTAPTFDVLPT